MCSRRRRGRRKDGRRGSERAVGILVSRGWGRGEEDRWRRCDRAGFVNCSFGVAVPIPRVCQGLGMQIAGGVGQGGVQTNGTLGGGRAP